MTKHQRYHKRKYLKKCLKNGRRYFKEDKERVQKIFCDNRKDYLK